MDVPAIDMTDAVAASQKAARPGRRKKAKRAASAGKQPAKTATAKAQPKRTRDGSVGRDTFERVEALVKTGKTKTEAFKQIANDTGRNEDTVSANYYRAARANGAVTPRQHQAKVGPARTARRRQGAAQSLRNGRGAPTGNSSGGLDLIVDQLVANVQALTEAVKAQDAEVRELRGRLDGLRRAIG